MIVTRHRCEGWSLVGGRWVCDVCGLGRGLEQVMEARELSPTELETVKRFGLDEEGDGE